MEPPIALPVEEEVAVYLRAASASRGKRFEAIDREALLFDKGLLDSLSLLDLIAFLERRFDIEIPGGEILPENFATLSAIAHYLRQRLGPGTR